MSDLFERAERWLSHDTDPGARAELSALIAEARSSGPNAARALTDLSERFAGPLEFGTAGLRGVMGAGESRMNRAVVSRTAAGLGAYLLDVCGDLARAKGVVVGYDGRKLGPEFVEDTISTLAALGIPTHVSPRPCPTPLTAFAVHALGAAAGVMVTASHNPPEYNGYKVYWTNAAQIIPPHDTGIAAKIEKTPPADQVARMPVEEARAKGLSTLFSDDIENTYLAEVKKLSIRSDGDRSFPIVYTPLHGVGNRLARRALAEAGFTHVVSVPEQAEPDGAFPTVAFPNPEEKGALDLALALAEREKADLIVANDPDVDRLALAVRGPEGRFIPLTGNQVGVLLGHYVLTEGKKVGERVVLASCVSSPMLGAIATKLGVHYEETLTGFKWIANRAMELERTRNMSFVFGFEEALGYTVGPLVRDKDGISAAMLASELTAVLRARGKNLLDELGDLYRRYGLYVSSQRSMTLKGADGLEKIGAIMTRLRANHPSRVGALGVVAVRDLDAQKRTLASGAVEAIDLPKSNVLVFELDGGSRIIARPSGTEPKIKFYFDVCEQMNEGEPMAAAEARANGRMADLATAFTAIAV